MPHSLKAKDFRCQQFIGSFRVLVAINLCTFWILPVFSLDELMPRINDINSNNGAEPPAPNHHQQIDERFGKLAVQPEDFDRVRSLHMNIYYGGIKALIGHFGKQLYRKLPQGSLRLDSAYRCLL